MGSQKCRGKDLKVQFHASTEIRLLHRGETFVGNFKLHIYIQRSEDAVKNRETMRKEGLIPTCGLSGRRPWLRMVNNTRCGDGTVGTRSVHISIVIKYTQGKKRQHYRYRESASKLQKQYR